MSKRVKSQLELYLEELEVNGTEEVVSVKVTSTNSNPWWQSLECFDHLCAWAEVAMSFTLVGVIEDSAIIMESWGGTYVKRMSPASGGPEDVVVLGLRRCWQLIITWNAMNIWINKSFTSPHAIAYVVHSAVLLMFYGLVLFPIILGAVMSYVDKRVAQKFRVAQHTTEHILGVIKRVQLVNMGSSISHPMPPVAKLEESFLRSHSEGNGGMLSCGEMRVSLRDALLRLQTFLRENNATSSVHVRSVATVSQLEALTGAVFQQQREQRDRPLNTLLSGLTTLKRDGWKRVGVRTHHESDDTEEDLLIEEITRESHVLLRAVKCLGILLALPLQLSNVLHETEVYISRCRYMCGGLIDAEHGYSTDAALASLTSSPTHSPRSYEYSDTYLSARQKLNKLRAAYEDLSVRLWLADRQLAEASALQFLLPDAALLSTQSPSVLRIENIDATLDRLCGGTRLSSTHTCENHNEVLEGVELMLSGLPTFRDFELLCDDLHLLRAASCTGSTPACCKSDTSLSVLTAAPTHAISEHSAASDGTSNPSIVVSRDLSSQSVYEENSTHFELTRAGASSLLDPTKTGNILDVYTTVIPRRAVTPKKADVSAADQAAIARERAQARLLFRELNQHLRRLHTPVTPQTVPSDCADAVNCAESDARLPMTGQYALERVRHISSKPATSGIAETDETDAELQIETNLAQIDPTTFGLRDLSDSDDETEGAQDASNGALREVKAFRVGTMLLTEEELRVTSTLSQPSILPTSDVRSFQEEMRQALRDMQPVVPVGGTHPSGRLPPPPVSAFALAMRANQLQEATFGDDLSD